MGAAFLQVAFAISTFLEIINVFKENKEKKTSSALKIELWPFFPSKAKCNFSRMEDNNSNGLDFFSQII